MPARSRLPLGLKLAYSVGGVAFGIKDFGLKFFLMLYYNQVLGVPATWVGAASAVALCVDAVVDPVIGYWSDNLHSRWGRRHPPMYAAMLPIALAYGLLWDPPSGLGQAGLCVYLFGMTVLVRILISFYEVPNSALTPDLTDDYDERTSVVGFRIVFGLAGGLGLVVLALVAFLRPTDTDTAGQLVAAGYVKYGWASAFFMLATSLVSALGTHRRIPLLKPAPPRQPFAFERSRREIWQSMSHPSLRRALGAIFFAGLAGGLGSTLSYYYNTYFWELTPPQTIVLVGGLFVGMLVAMPLGAGLARRYEKKGAALALVVASLINGPLPQLLRLLGWFPPNGHPALLPLLFLHSLVATALGLAAAMLIIAMVTDIVEDSQVETGRRSEGLFLASATLVNKCATGVGLLASGALIDAIGFPLHAVPGQVEPAILRNLVLAYTPAIILLYLLMLGFLATYRIDRARHEANLRHLAEVAAAPGAS